MDVNGQPLAAESPEAFNMYNSNDLMVTTSALDKAGNGFETTFVANS